MAERSGIYNKSGQYMDIDLATWNSLLKHDIGVVLGVGDELKVNTGTGLEVKVGTGGCWLGEPCGWWYYNDAQKSLILDAEVEGYKRADRIVVRHDRNADALESVVVVKKGTPATVDPQPPVLQQDGMVFELPLAQATVTGGTNEIELVDDRGLDYTENMQTAYAVIGKSQTCRVISHMPTDADGYYLCWKETEWIEGDDENTGTRVGDFAENYIGDNIWYTVEGLQNNNTYYLKWFPYKGDNVNRIIGVNEDTVLAQKGIAFWSMDNVSGSTILDSFNSNNLNKGSSAIFTPFKIGNGLKYNADYGVSCSTGDFTPSVFSLIFWRNTTSLAGTCIKQFSWTGGIAHGFEIKYRSDGGIDFVTGNGSSASSHTKPLTSCGLEANADQLVCFVINTSTSVIKVYINGVFKISATGNTIAMNTVSSFVFGDNNEKVDQMMIVEGEITEENQLKLYNGGAGW